MSLQVHPIFLTIPRTSIKFDTQWEKGEDPRIVVWIYL
jgi:hypothetical protein